ncbi:MAG: sigma 54-interacting transcriptional regulator [Firmicutes bacterium]|nr:sigma 54-interacting transcriptional regulator [Bacillota bacterium]HPU01735.1 sigma 54-interacting transcriptional regulator [Bacillota bacterium]
MSTRTLPASEIEKIRRENELLTSALNIIEEGIHIVDSSGKTFFYSKSLEKIENTRAENVLGKHITETYQLDEDSSILLRVLKTGKPVKNHHTTYFTREGKKIDIITNTFPISANGTIIGAVSVNSDITNKKQLIDTLIQLQKQLYSSHARNGTQYTFDDIIGESAAIRETIEHARRVAVSMSPVLIYGETGTGKELFAQSIHNCSLRAKGPFVAVNCAAIPATLLESILFGTEKGAFTGAEDKPGLFEEADKGTLFLDEISSMDVSLQTKLLRVLESKTVRRLGGKSDIRVNPRIFSAINTDPLEAIKKGKLRQDLYYRLAVVTLTIPPLRQRMEDLPLLVRHFISQANKIMYKRVKDVTPEVMALFQQHNWPGNVRELRHAVEHAMNLAEDDAEYIEPRHIPAHLLQKYREPGYSYERGYESMRGKQNLKQLLQVIEREIIVEALNSSGHNISRAARALGISRQNLQQRIKRLQIK